MLLIIRIGRVLGIVVAVMGVLGITVVGIWRWIRKLRGLWSDRKLRKYIDLGRMYHTPENVVRALGQFYGSSLPAERMFQYSLTVNGKKLPTSVYCRPTDLGINKPALQVDMHLCSLNARGDTGASFPRVVRKYAGKVEGRLKAMEIVIEDLPQYRLIEFRDGPRSFGFSVSNYRNYRFTSGLLEDELTDALIKYKGDATEILKRPRRLPVRTALLPDLKSLLSTSHRQCLGGIGVLFAMRRNEQNHDDYYFPLQRRSKKVADQRELFALIPKGFHGPSVHPEDAVEVNVHWSVFRELFEELLKGKEAEKPQKYLQHNWYFQKREALGWFAQEANKASWSCEVVSFGLNAHSGNYEFAVLLVVTDPSYWNAFGSKMKASWEAEEIYPYSTKEPDKLARLLLDRPWASEGLFHIAEALRRLSDLDPQHVLLPEISVAGFDPSGKDFSDGFSG